MPESLWLFSVLSGYYFLTRYVYFKYKCDRLETQRLVFNSIISGSLIFLFVYFVRVIVGFFTQNGYVKPITFYIDYQYKSSL